MILQITETLAPVIESAKNETSSFTLLFMLLVLVAVCVALWKLYNDNKAERKENVEERKELTREFATVLEKLNLNIFDLSKNVATNTLETQKTNQVLSNLNDLIRDRHNV